MKKIVLFDIDYTLFDVSYFHKNLYKRLEKITGIESEKLKNNSLEIISDLINKESFLDINRYMDLLLGSVSKAEFKKKFEDLLFNQYFFKNGFYKEVGKTLKDLEKIAEIGLFSHGDEKFQWAKIEQSDFKHYFKNELKHITSRNKLDLLPGIKSKNKNNRVYLIDDNPEIIYSAKKIMPALFTIWLKRGKYVDRAKDYLDFNPDDKIDNLLEVVDIVKNN